MFHSVSCFILCFGTMLRDEGWDWDFAELEAPPCQEPVQSGWDFLEFEAVSESAVVVVRPLPIGKRGVRWLATRNNKT
jgi:hypothetical protein